MHTCGEFDAGLPELDPLASQDHLGPVPLHDPTQDIDGDGIPDTGTVSGDTSLTVWSDLDHDGFADHVTSVDHEGDYAAWEYHRNMDGTGSWIQTGHGKMGGDQHCP